MRKSDDLNQNSVMNFLSLHLDCEFFVALKYILLHMFLAVNNREVNFMHQILEFTLTRGKMLLCKFTIRNKSFSHQVLNIFEVVELLVTIQLVSKHLPVMEVGNKSQSSFHVFVESLEGQVFEVSDGIWTFSQ